MAAPLQQPQAHPRRPPAHKSVCLIHSPRMARSPSRLSQSHLAEAHDQTHQSPSRSSKLKPGIQNISSGESGNAETWFDKSNNNAKANCGSSDDSDPPFFLPRSSSGDTSLYNERRLGFALHNFDDTVLHQMNAPNADSDDSSSDDFRGVIDDLTIENKKLKLKLKRYEQLHDSHLDDEKLFEVRVHGLPTHKKRELEEMLRKFAGGLTPGCAASTTAMSIPNASELSVAPYRVQKLSSTSSNQFADSAYASASASGQGQTSMQGASNTGASNERKSTFAPTAKSREQNIHSYLHDIPQGLLPHRPTAMTEKTKKKLVVRRLEQIYAGKGANLYGHQQPQQQQEISNSAANADRSASEARGQSTVAEGIREAQFMLKGSAGVQNDSPDATADSTERVRYKSAVVEREFASSASPPSPEQRPTRPLDLDIQRAQVPADNMQYMQHLGFSPPRTEFMEAPQEGHGWIYLNLLVNMAQLHTLNVTADFVKRALADYSKKFELSYDGRKVRWRGGQSPTRSSSDGGTTPSAPPESSETEAEAANPRKRAKRIHGGNGLLGGPWSRVKSSAPGRLDDKLAYVPLFYHHDSTDDGYSSMASDDEDTDTPGPVQQSGNRFAVNNGRRTVTGKRKTAQDFGPIIFYNNARFCTDLSGDRNTEEDMRFNPIVYKSVATQPIGACSARRPAAIIVTETRRPNLSEPVDVDDDDAKSAAQILDFPSQTPMSSQAGLSPTAIKLEASGLAGILPADNFAINVKSRHAELDDGTAPETVRVNLSRRYSSRLADVLHSGDGRPTRSAFHKEILGTRRQDLPPSELPPASCFVSLDGSDADSDVSDADIELPESLDAPGVLPPAAARQPINMDLDSESEDDEESGVDYESDGSVDLLATAREIDPEAVRAREREYDANMAERLADIIPAGSSAATFGGGSGFASPEFGITHEDYAAARKAAREASEKAGFSRDNRPSLGRTETHDSLLVNLQEEL